MELNRQQALALLQKYNKEPFHIQHALTVEGVLRWYAQCSGEDAEFWGLVGLLHGLHRHGRLQAGLLELKDAGGHCGNAQRLEGPAKVGDFALEVGNGRARLAECALAHVTAHGALGLLQRLLELVHLPFKGAKLASCVFRALTEAGNVETHLDNWHS